MTKKDYRIIAAALGDACPDYTSKEFEMFVDIVQSIVDRLTWDNPKFNADYFVQYIFTGKEK